MPARAVRARAPVDDRVVPVRLRHDDSGFSLMEVLVSALLVALVATFVMTSFSTASHSSGRSKARGTAASLAQQDQERLRAMSVTNLSSVNSSRTVNVCGDTSGGCIPYTVASRADWVADNSGASTCAVSAARAYNVQITSTVTWPGMTVNPLVTNSLVAAPPNTAGGPQG